MKFFESNTLTHTPMSGYEFRKFLCVVWPITKSKYNTNVSMKKFNHWNEPNFSRFFFLQTENMASQRSIYDTLLTIQFLELLFVIQFRKIHFSSYNLGIIYKLKWGTFTQSFNCLHVLLTMWSKRYIRRNRFCLQIWAFKCCSSQVTKWCF